MSQRVDAVDNLASGQQSLLSHSDLRDWMDSEKTIADFSPLSLTQIFCC